MRAGPFNIPVVRTEADISLNRAELVKALIAVNELMLKEGPDPTLNSLKMKFGDALIYLRRNGGST